MSSNQLRTSPETPIDDFRTRVFWRWDNYKNALREGLEVDAAGTPVTPDEGVIAHGLDSIDLFLRGHLVGEYNLRHANTQIRHHIGLFKLLHRSHQSAYESIFFLFVDCWNDMMELELYELVPRLKAALEKITVKFFKEASPLRFPEDPTSSQEQQTFFAYGFEISPEWEPETSAPESPLDYVLKLYPPSVYVDAGYTKGHEGEALRVCYFMDDVSLAFRRWLMNPRSNLRPFFASVDKLTRQFPTITPDRLVSLMIDKDLRSHFVKYEVWEIMHRFDKGWAKIRKRYGIE